MAKKIKQANNYKQEPIAVIGMSCIFPEAPDVKTFWQNILNGVNAIGSPLPEWEAGRYLESGRITTAQGGYLKDLFRIDPKEFGIMPKSLDGSEPDQFLALQVAKRALEDAGRKYLDSDYNHNETGIVLGHSTYYHRGQVNATQHTIILDQTIEILQSAMPMDAEQELKVRELLKKQLPQFNADICPSQVPNLMTGRIANRMNFSGPNYIIDAACASSLLAVNAAIDELRKGTSRMMLAGGVNASLPPEAVVMFTMIDALSKTGKVRPFEEGSNGTLMGEGLGVVVLKRLSDAIEDGDKVYALVHAVGQSSDGKGFGLLAPSEKGETLAIKRAYEAAGIDPQTIGLFEAHGTGIALGDKTEISTIKGILGERLGEQGSVAIGSVKSMISHCIPAAGIASFIKMCLSLHHKVLPPTLCEKVNPELGIEKTPLYINNSLKPWISKLDEPCRAGINSFGFGGVNAHAILEEAPANVNKPLKYSPWGVELCTFASDDIDGLKTQLNQLGNFLKCRDDVALSDVAYSLWLKASLQKGSCRLALVVKDIADLRDKIEQATVRFDKNGDKPLMGKGSVIFNNKPLGGKLAFVFPGEGSQYLGMLSDLASHFEPVRQWFDLWHGLYDETPGSTRTDIVFPVNSELTEDSLKALEKRLYSMDVGSEAVFIAGQAMYSLLECLGVSADVMVGHSSGESSALVASKAMKYNNIEQIGDFVRQINKVYREIEAEGGIVTGTLMAIALLSKEKIAEYIKNTDVFIAMENCPTQIIVFGDKKSVAKLYDVLVADGAICEILPFDRGYHTPLFAPMQKAFAKYYKDIDLSLPQVPLYSCASANLFPNEVDGVRELAAAQWANNVRFIDTIQAMHNDGVNYFIEVGPSGKLTSFIEQILRNKGCVIAASNVNSQEGLPQLLTMLAKLYVNDKFGAEKLFAGRDVKIIDFNKLEKAKPFGMYMDNTMPRLYATPDLVEMFKSIRKEPQRVAVEKQDLLPEYYPFINEIVELNNNNFVGYSRLCLAEDNFLQDHILSGMVSEDPNLRGLSCVPLMVTLEIMAEACAILARSIDLAVIEDVNTFNWIVLDNEEVNLEVRVRGIDGLDNAYFAEVFNGQNKVMSAKYLFVVQANFICEPLPELENANQEFFCPDDYELYTLGMFHGPIFQGVKTVNGWNDTSIEATLSNISLQGFFRNGETPKFILNPVLLDVVTQLPAFWLCQNVGTNFNSFPSKISRIEFYANCPDGFDSITSRGISSGSSVDSRIWDLECFDGNGNPLLRIGGFNNIFYTVPNEFYRCRHDPLNGWIGSPFYNENDNELNWHLRYLPEEFCMKSGGVFFRVLAYCMLDAEERDEWNELKMTHSEKCRWLFSRICVKEAIRFWIYQKTGKLLYPSDVVVGFDNDGQPFVYGWWMDKIIEAPNVTIHYGQGESFAVVSAAECQYQPLIGNL